MKQQLGESSFVILHRRLPQPVKGISTPLFTATSKSSTFSAVWRIGKQKLERRTQTRFTKKGGGGGGGGVAPNLLGFPFLWRGKIKMRDHYRNKYSWVHRRCCVIMHSRRFRGTPNASLYQNQTLCGKYLRIVYCHYYYFLRSLILFIFHMESILEKIATIIFSTYSSSTLKKTKSGREKIFIIRDLI